MNDLAELRRIKYRNGIGNIQHRRDIMLLSEAKTVRSAEDTTKSVELKQHPEEKEFETQEYTIQPETELMNIANTEQTIETYDLVVLDETSLPLLSGDEYWEEKKKLFGGTKMVKRTVK